MATIFVPADLASYLVSCAARHHFQAHHILPIWQSESNEKSICDCSVLKLRSLISCDDTIESVDWGHGEAVNMAREPMGFPARACCRE
jgi:hypothetical protein